MKKNPQLKNILAVTYQPPKQILTITPTQTLHIRVTTLQKVVIRAVIRITTPQSLKIKEINFSRNVKQKMLIKESECVFH